jgi:hypothetical protein
MPEQRILQLDALLLTANENIALLTQANGDLSRTNGELTKANAGLVEAVAAAELQSKKLRRNSRRDTTVLRGEITALQGRRG